MIECNIVMAISKAHSFRQFSLIFLWYFYLR